MPRSRGTSTRRRKRRARSSCRRPIRGGRVSRRRRQRGGLPEWMERLTRQGSPRPASTDTPGGLLPGEVDLHTYFAMQDAARQLDAATAPHSRRGRSFSRASQDTTDSEYLSNVHPDVREREERLLGLQGQQLLRGFGKGPFRERSPVRKRRRHPRSHRGTPRGGRGGRRRTRRR